MIDNLQWKREYTIDGKQVHAEVIEAEAAASGAIRAMVRTSCEGPDSQIYHQTNTITLTDPSGTQLETFMQNCATWLKKLKWDRPRVVLFVAKLLKADGNHVNLTCSFNIAQPLTFIHPTWVELAALPRTGTFVPPENPGIALPVHRARFGFGERIFETDVVAADANMSCVIGSGLVLQAVGENTEFLYDVFLTDISRALGNAARAKRRTVLVLGSYSDPGGDRLARIRAKLKAIELDGVSLDGFADIHQQSLFEKMLMFGSLAKFVVCDESAASGHLIELKACSDIGFVTAILRNQGRPVTWMNSDIAAERTYMKVFSYASDGDLEQAVKGAVEWANSRVDERSDYYNRLYPWRNKNFSLG